jgi:hypothetical protein
MNDDGRGHIGDLRKRSALPMTDTELMAIAAAANIGDSKIPNDG